MDTLRNQIIERKVIELIQQNAEFKDVPYKPPKETIAAVNYAVAGAGEAIPDRRARRSGTSPVQAPEDEGLASQCRAK